MIVEVVYNPYGEVELYDMARDPHDLYNLAHQMGYRHVLRRMKECLINRRQKTNSSIVDEESWKNNPYDLYISGRGA